MKAFWGWCLIFAVSAAAHGADISFWDTTRQGATVSGTNIDLDLLNTFKAKGVRLIRLVTGHWRSHQKNFLLGDAVGFFQLVPRDLIRLFQVVNLCHDQGFRVVLTTAVLPGLSYPMQFLWKRPETLATAGEFWRQLAVGFKGHPAVVGYDLLDNPAPDKVPRAVVSVDTFSSQMLEAIRYVDSETPVIVESGEGSTAIGKLTPLSDNRVLYSFQPEPGGTIASVREWQKKHQHPGQPNPRGARRWQ